MIPALIFPKTKSNKKIFSKKKNRILKYFEHSAIFKTTFRS